MKTLIAGSHGRASVVPARGGGVRHWQRWAPYAAIAWSLVYAALGVYWALSGRGFPYPPDTVSDVMAPLLGRFGLGVAWIVVLMAGTNNVGRSTPLGDIEERAADVARGVSAVVREIRKRAPDATVVITGITPRNDNIAVMPVINRANQQIAALADGKKTRYVNINAALALPDNRLREGMANDGLHLTVKAYQVWADALKPIFTEILGAPAAVDHAPPPTGDPSAQKTLKSP